MSIEGMSVNRWKCCVRVKRGCQMTNSIGGNYKDQVYLIGAIEIIKKRKAINMRLLYSGKLSLEDCLYNKMVSKDVDLVSLKFPKFLENDNYFEILNKIAKDNYIE